MAEETAGKTASTIVGIMVSLQAGPSIPPRLLPAPDLTQPQPGGAYDTTMYSSYAQVLVATGDGGGVKTERAGGG